MFYPIYLNLTGKRVVVIGGGEVAERKIEPLLDAGASINVVSPEVTSRILTLAGEKRIELHQRPFRAGDCAGATLVLCATDDGAVSREVFEQARTTGALVNTADQPALCDFIMPAVVRRGDIAIAISTSGTSPGLAARLRQKIARLIGPEYGRLAQLLSEARPQIRRQIPGEKERKALQYRILDSDIMTYLKENDIEGAERRLREIIES
ncbi:MAG TPA: bifunctional precorrin-2 dehydrogenase/sirohydrochlorin ferrochelatase [Terriglobia bacterium]|jgi:siroheme synthase-like protein